MKEGAPKAIRFRFLKGSPQFCGSLKKKTVKNRWVDVENDTKQVLSYKFSVFESNIFVCALLGAFTGITMFFEWFTTFFSLVLWDIAAGLLWAAAPLLVLFLLLLCAPAPAPATTGRLLGTPVGGLLLWVLLSLVLLVVWSGLGRWCFSVSTVSAALCAVLGFWSGDSSGCHFAAGLGWCSECCSGWYFGCDWG